MRQGRIHDCSEQGKLKLNLFLLSTCCALKEIAPSSNTVEHSSKPCLSVRASQTEADAITHRMELNKSKLIMFWEIKISCIYSRIGWIGIHINISSQTKYIYHDFST